MNRKWAYGLLAGEAVLCAVMGLNGWLGASMVSWAAWPLAPIAAGLRGLSLGSSAGNTAAWVLYLAIGLAPAVGTLICAALGRRLRVEDGVLSVLLSILLLWGLYANINPQVMGTIGQSESGRGILQAMVGGACWSVVLAWGVIKLVRLLVNASGMALLRPMGRVLLVVAALLVMLVFGVSLPGMVEEWRAQTDGLTAFMQAMDAVTQLVPTVLMVGALAAFAFFAESFRDGQPTEETLRLGEQLTRFCGMSMGISAGLMAVVNGGMLLLLPRLREPHVQVKLPLTSLALLALVLLLCRLARRNKQLTDENDLFV